MPVERFEQAQTGLGGPGPVYQGVLLQGFESGVQVTGLGGHAHFAFAEDHAGAGIEHIEQQAAGRRIRAVVVLVEGRQGVDRADRQGIGTALGGVARQLFQRQTVAKAAVAGAPQAVQLHGKAPATGRGLLHAVLQGMATRRCHGHGTGPAIDIQAVIAQGQAGRQPRLGVQGQTALAAVFQTAADLAGGAEVTLQVQGLVDVDGQQRWQRCRPGGQGRRAPGAARYR
ncbi:hypothetical protein WR25_01135 [Diploscapter pachys]|uniref:Uncharacterized protein n=1 Tax=Diploscapter pachys TaxID=2018661 RepID=A0A2A2M439_9BILA|nr:hypothetical protein WR25_01135 [Diploscapter pachys]